MGRENEEKDYKKNLCNYSVCGDAFEYNWRVYLSGKGRQLYRAEYYIAGSHVKRRPVMGVGHYRAK